MSVTEVLKSLEKYDNNPRKHSISDEHKSTFHWIWTPIKEKGPGFVDWLESGTSIFWIAGKPGAGKSTLMKYIFNDNQISNYLSNGTHDTKKFGFFFHELGRPNEKVFVGFLQSFLYQLIFNFPALTHSILSIYREIERHCAGTELSWTDIDTRRALEEIARQDSVRGNICMFIDGLDECDNGSMQGEDIDYIVDLGKWKALSVKICVSSRPLLPLELRFQGFPRLLVQQRTSGDISKYVSDELQKSFKLARRFSTRDSSFLEELTSTIVEKAEGVFLWVKLVVRDLKVDVENSDSDTDIKSRLDALPEGINDLYTTIFGKISPEYLHDAINFLGVLSLPPGRALSLHDFSFIIEGPAKALERPFASIRKSEMTERCRRAKGRILSRTRNLIEFHTDKDIFSSKNGDTNDESLLSEKPPSLGSSTEDAAKEISDYKPEDISLLNEKVDLIHRTLEEYTKSSRWELVVKRAFPGRLIDPSFSLLACNFAILKTTPVYWEPPKGGGMWTVISGMGIYARRAERLQKIEHFSFLRAIDADLRKKRPIWIELWGMPPVLECDILCLAAQERLDLFLEETISQMRTPDNLNHLIPHFISSFLPRDGEVLKAIEALLRMGCRVDDEFQGFSAWEYALLWSLCTQNRHENQVWELFLDNGANANQSVPPLIRDRFPRHTILKTNKQLERYNLPCSPLHVLLRNGTSEYGSRFPSFQLIKKFLLCGADLQARDAGAETVLDAAAHYRFNSPDHGGDEEEDDDEERDDDEEKDSDENDDGNGNLWDLRPILLYLERECKDAEADQTESQLKDVARKPIPDLARYLDNVDTNDEKMEKLRDILFQIEKTGD
ncbi:hypothetical protein BDZ45DRAFT_457266 [Acephala macrosclerotiorum]|nr:hypothetical protein BDZ45DRAFT_457266 [Acephala macrosclerotiorum]